MTRWTTLVPLAILTIGAVDAAARRQGFAEARPIPGASGPRVELVDKPPQPLEIVDVFVYARPEQAAYNVSRPNRFESALKKLTLDIRVKELKRLGTVIRFELVTTSGTVDTTDGFFSFARLEREGVSSMELDLLPKHGIFADGPYQLKLFMNEILVAVLNWEVGEL
jgi:hypothetical protein